MAKKHSRHAARREARQPPATPSAALQEARESLAARRFRDAIGQFKELLKTEVRAQALEGLAVAYEGRARELADKGMLKEALVIWQNRAQACPAAPLVPEYVALLLRAGRARDAVRALRQGADVLPAEDQARLRGLFAAQYLADPSALVGALPPDDPVLVHGTPARLALEAYCRGDDGAAEEALRQIPFRSPYRDWVQALRAMLRIGEDRDAAVALLQRVPADSPFASLVGAVRLALQPEQAFLDALPAAAEAERRVAARLRGWPEQRLTLWEELHGLGLPPPPFAMLGLLHRRRQSLGEDWARSQGLRLLVDGYPQSLQWPQRLGARPLSPLERGLVAAWNAEQSGDPRAAFEDWVSVIVAIRDAAEIRPGSDEALRIALIQRRLATRWKLLEGPERARVEAHLEESLRLDPEDRDAYVLLAAHYRGRRELQAMRRVLDEALDRWPEDVGVLGECLEAAVAGEAFKKATGFARRILALDPINRRARQSLLRAHLSHARKQIKRARPDLARRELEHASEWASGAQDEARLDLLRVIGLSEGAPAARSAQLASAIDRLGGGMTGQLEVALEAVQLGRSPLDILTRAGLRVPECPEKADLLLFCRRLRELLEAGADVPPLALHLFGGALRAGSRLDLSRQESEAVCETLRLLPWDAVRPLYARAALERWPGEPVFELHALEGRGGARRGRLSRAERARLERAADRARQAGDTRTAHRLEELLLGPRFSFPFPMEDDRSSPPGPGGEMGEAELDVLIELLPDGAAKREFRKLERQIGRKAAMELLLEALDGLTRDAADAFPPPSRRATPAPKGGRPEPDAGPGRADSAREGPAAPEAGEGKQLDLFK